MMISFLSGIKDRYSKSCSSRAMKGFFSAFEPLFLYGGKAVLKLIIP